MPSLNLRGMENKVIMLFTKERRTQVSLPPFVKKQPYKNVLAIQSAFKLITHYRYLREYIIYHLNMGVDKFFLYDNNRDPNNPSYYT